MRNFVLSAAVALALFTPAAVAEEKAGKVVEVEVQFEPSLLESDAGIHTLMGMVESKARRACTTRFYPYGNVRDEACVQEIVSKAASQIAGKRNDAGQQQPSTLLSSLAGRSAS